MLTTLSSVHTNDCKDCPCKYVSISDSFFTLAGSNKYQEIKNRIDANPSLVNKLDDYGYSALHYAARENHVSVVRLLLSKGGSPDNNSCGATPLLRAAYAGSYESCEALLKAGANVNSIDLSFHDGRTPLHKASSNGHDDVMELLLQHGADTTIVDKDGKTPQDIYKINVQPSIVTDDDPPTNLPDPPPISPPVILVCASATTTPTRTHGTVCPKCLQVKLSFKKVKNSLICTDCS